MNKRERWTGCLHYQPVDWVPDVEMGYWADTLAAWHQQGLPEYVDTVAKTQEFFGLEGVEDTPLVPVATCILPDFEYQVLEENESHLIIRDTDGVIKQTHKGTLQSIPKYIKFPVETRQDWEDFKYRLNPDDPARMVSEAEASEWIRTTDEESVVRRYFAGGLLGFLRNWMGFEGLAMAAMDDPDWVKEMIDHIADLYCAMADKGLKRFGAEYAIFWEDVAFNKGPMLSPKLFREWLTPNYKRITDIMTSHGCDLAMVDCDGCINSIVDCYLDGGVNMLFPLEVRGNTDPYWIRKTYGKEARLCGGVDKTQIAAGKSAIDAELARLRPLIEDGGYIPHIDHSTPPDISLENYQYYLKQKRKTLGAPQPAPWEERKHQYNWAE